MLRSRFTAVHLTNVRMIVSKDTHTIGFIKQHTLHWIRKHACLASSSCAHDYAMLTSYWKRHTLLNSLTYELIVQNTEPKRSLLNTATVTAVDQCSKT